MGAKVNHDRFCPPGLKPHGPDDCPHCGMLASAREDEQQKLIGLAEAAYARGREDAAVAVREFAVNGIPFLPSDTPLSMAVRVKEILSIAAMGVKPPNGPEPTD